MLEKLASGAWLDKSFVCNLDKLTNLVTTFTMERTQNLTFCKMVLPLVICTLYGTNCRSVLVILIWNQYTWVRGLVTLSTLPLCFAFTPPVLLPKIFLYSCFFLQIVNESDIFKFWEIILRRWRRKKIKIRWLGWFLMPWKNFWFADPLIWAD